MPRPSRPEYVAAVLFGPYYGLDPWTARHWPGADDLSGADRTAAICATRRNTALWEARLAPAVIGYSRALHDTRDRFFRWHDSVFVGVCAYLAFVLFGNDRFPLLSVAVGLTVAVAFFVVSGMWGLRRTLSKAANAEAAARKIVEYPAAEDD